MTMSSNVRWTRGQWLAGNGGGGPRPPDRRGALSERVVRGAVTREPARQLAVCLAAADPRRLGLHGLRIVVCEFDDHPVPVLDVERPAIAVLEHIHLGLGVAGGPQP